jgi:hypothetical protein
MSQSFPLARMSPLIRGTTIVLLLLPVLFLGISLSNSCGADSVLGGVSVGLMLLYGGVWLYSRPTRFEVDRAELVLIWPIRRARIARAEIRGARVLSSRELRAEFGAMIRIGVGGLWGGFGWLSGPGLGLVDLYVSRRDDWVMIERAQGRPLVITPEDPHELVRQLTPDG